MRHGNKINHLGRTTSHRHAMLSNMATSLIITKRITTTVAKAKELRKYIEPLVTKAKDDSTHSRRIVFGYLQNKEGVKELFGNVANKVADRPGGYTRILKIGNRLGDNAEMCMMEFVDFNELLGGGKLVAKESATTKRTRRGSSKKEGADTTTPVAKAPKMTPVVAAPVADEEIQEVEVIDEVETPEVVAANEEAEVVEAEVEEVPEVEFVAEANTPEAEFVPEAETEVTEEPAAKAEGEEKPKTEE
ncbi:MAG: 50S ribosomal protein L17 [Bacteroidia bacterium]